MNLFLVILLIVFGSQLCSEAYAQSVTNSNYQTVAHIKSDGTIQDANYRTIGHIKDDGTVQDWYILGGGDDGEYTILFAASPMTSWLPFANQSQDLDYKAEWECTYLSPVTTVH